ncbi:unnamed protein product, partial [Staurois parvus]
MQVPVLGCTFLTLSDRPLMISALMIGAQQCHPQVPPSSAPTSSAHLCPADHPPVPSSAPTCATLQCHLHVP